MALFRKVTSGNLVLQKNLAQDLGYPKEVSPLRTHLPPLTHFQLNFLRLIGLVFRSSVALTPTLTQMTLKVTLKRRNLTTNNVAIFLFKTLTRPNVAQITHGTILEQN